MEQQIHHADQVIQWFGYWPSFHDAEIHWVKLQRGLPIKAGNVAVEMLLHTWELTNQVQPDGYLRRRKHCLIHFRFEGCVAIHLEGFNQQNQLHGLQIATQTQKVPKNKLVPEDFVLYIEDNQTQVAEEYLEIQLDAAFGMQGGFKCYRGEVVSLGPCDEQGRPLGE